MSQLRVYGDSFSDVYMPDKVEKFWFEILRDTLKLRLNHKARSGHGWFRIKGSIFNDVNKWDFSDVIIICPSYFTRVDIVEFHIDYPIDIIDAPWIVDLDCHVKREAYVMKDWYNTIKFFKKCGYNVYTWALDKVDPEYQDITILPPPGFESWMEWILSDKDHWVIPYPHPGGHEGAMIERDSHFSTLASRRVAEYFLKHINKNEIKSSNLL